jgi:hypothetical protein
MSNPCDFTVNVCNDRDIVISKPEAGGDVSKGTLLSDVGRV